MNETKLQIASLTKEPYNLTQQQIAKDLGLSQTQVSRYLNGKVPVAASLPTRVQNLLNKLDQKRHAAQPAA